MAAQSDNLLEMIDRFVETLAADDETVRSAHAAIAQVSDGLNIGKLTGHFESAHVAGEAGEREAVLFVSERGFDGSQFREFDFHTSAPGNGRLVVYPLPDVPFEEEKVRYLQMVLRILLFHLGRFRMIEKVQNSALTQFLTGLPNTGGYLRACGEKLALGTLWGFDAFYFNLRRFGLINKRFGQKEGNEIICRYVNKLKRFFLPDELFGHLGGDNFVALVHKGDRSKTFIKVLEGVPVSAFRNGEEVPIVISAMVGVMSIEMPCSLDNIIGGPAIALARAKLTKEPVVYLTSQLNDEVNRAKAIEQGFERSLERGEYTVFYQPKVNTMTGEIIGAEALTRWFEDGKMVSPIVFIPVLEQCGKISKLDLKMLEMVCRDIAEWKEAGHRAVPISVNFSRRDLHDPELPIKILGLINQYGISQNEIVIEVTETASEEEKTEMTSFLTKLKDFGIETSIDDFGTGYSSLSVLREFPVGEIKIDRSFINGELNRSNEIIVRSIIDMANNLGIDVITEGVEIIEQRNFLHNLGCDRVQGFLYDRPLPKEEFQKRLKQGRYQIDSI